MYKDIIARELEKMITYIEDLSYTSLQEIIDKNYTNTEKYSGPREVDLLAYVGRADLERLVFSFKTDFSCQSRPINREFFSNASIEIIGELIINQVSIIYNIGLLDSLKERDRTGLIKNISLQKDKIIKNVEREIGNNIH